MKKKTLLFLVLILMPFLAMAQSADKSEHTLSFGALAGLLDGFGEEISYRGSDEGGFDSMLSQLLWEMKPLVYFGAELGYSWQSQASWWKNFFIDASFKFGLPNSVTGVMEDRDWIDPSIPNWLTHYSVHDNTTKEAYLADARIGMSFPFSRRYSETIRIKPYIAYSFMHFSWSANDGSVLHPDWHIPFLVSLPVITYKQTWHSVSSGVSLYGKFNRYFDIELSLQLGSVWCTAVDEHYYYPTEDKALVLTDTLSGLSLQTGLLLSFRPNDFFAIVFSLAYREHYTLPGTGVAEKYNSPSSFEVIKNVARGAGYEVFDIGIRAKFNLHF